MLGFPCDANGNERIFTFIPARSVLVRRSCWPESPAEFAFIAPNNWKHTWPIAMFADKIAPTRSRKTRGNVPIDWIKVRRRKMLTSHHADRHRRLTCRKCTYLSIDFPSFLLRFHRFHLVHVGLSANITCTCNGIIMSSLRIAYSLNCCWYRNSRFVRIRQKREKRWSNKGPKRKAVMLIKT